MTMPKIVRKIDDLRCDLAALRKSRGTVGFVPTMGALHQGHLELVRAARSSTDVVVASVFVNPTQFGPNEDFKRYPRDLKRDSDLLSRGGCDLVFAPSVEEMYPPGFKTAVRVDGLGAILCGEVRPEHFAGVTLVVLKLLLAVAPDKAFFGEKDYQQLVIVRRMAADLALPVEIVAVPTVRDKDGLALSSRNAYLSKDQRAVASSLYRSLELAGLLVAGGERRAGAIRHRLTSFLLDAGVTKVDYVAVVEPETLEPVPYIDKDVRVLVAAWVGDTRLIDNIPVAAPASARKTVARGLVGVILAAGEGKRMKSDRPKVLHTIAGKPMIEYVVGACRRAGVRQLIAVVGHGGSQVVPVMKSLDVRAVVQDVQRGTGHAVLQTYPLLRDFKGSVLVASGDTPLVSAETVRRIVQAHERHSNAITLGTARVPDPGGYGRILRDKRGAFAGIVEERDADGATRLVDEINGGLYCFRASVLFDGLLLLTADNSQMEYYLTDVVGIAKSRGGRVEAVLVEDHTEFAGVNTPQELALARRLHSKRTGRKAAQ